MFDQIVREKSARKPFAVALSVSGQAVVLGLALLVPLLHTEAITIGRLVLFVPLQPWGHDAVQPSKSATVRSAAKPGPRIFTDRVFREPPAVPSKIELTDDAPGGIAAIAGASTFGGTPDGVFGIVLAETPPPPRPAPPQTAAGTPSPVTQRVRVGGVVQAAKLLRQVKPVYPQLAKQARISGEVRLEAVISREGTVESLHVISGHPLLAPAALEAVRQWLYQPTFLDGDPVEVLTQIDVNFKLGE